MNDVVLPFTTRLGLAFRILSDGAFARRAHGVAGAEPALLAPEPPPEAKNSEPLAPGPSAVAPPAVSDAATERAEGGRRAALALLTLLQREGRLVDFVQQDITGFGDAELGAAARVVHEGCRRAFKAHVTVSSVRAEAEGTTVSVAAEEVSNVKLVGNVAGRPPYRGVLRHRGWRVEALKLPEHVGTQDPALVAAAEVEL